MDSISMHVNDKRIDVIRCYFCTKAKFDDGFSCTVNLPPSDNCKEFLKVEDVSVRVDEIFKKLPGE